LDILVIHILPRRNALTRQIGQELSEIVAIGSDSMTGIAFFNSYKAETSL
jgi:hypothetical protein